MSSNDSQNRQSLTMNKSDNPTCQSCKWCRTDKIPLVNAVTGEKTFRVVYRCFAQKNVPTVNTDDICAYWKSNVESMSPRTARYNGYTLMLYGKSSMSVCAPDGKEVFHTGNRNQQTYTHDEMVRVIKTVLELLEMYDNSNV